MHKDNLDRLERIEAQTTRTNGRVDELESDTSSIKRELASLWQKVKSLGRGGTGEDQPMTFRHAGWIIFLLALGIAIGIAFVKTGGAR